MWFALESDVSAEAVESFFLRMLEGNAPLPTLVEIAKRNEIHVTNVDEWLNASNPRTIPIIKGIVGGFRRSLDIVIAASGNFLPRDIWRCVRGYCGWPTF
jgi:hypothetical protein